jgi:hypothetical protein
MKRPWISLLVVAIIFAFGLSMVLTGCGKQGADKAGQALDVKKPQEAEVPPAPSMKPITEERTFFDFEEDLQGWEVPLWAEDKTDYVAKEVMISKDVASKGQSSMKVMSDFPGGVWTAGLVELQQYLDLSQYRAVMADVYIPADAPEGLRAKLILTVGSNWKFVEMSMSVPLIPGKWVTVSANIEPGSYDWKRVVPDEEFAQDVRKIAIRVESNRQPVYSGPVYIDNIRVGR